MHVDTRFSRRFYEAAPDERFSPSGHGPSLRAIFLGFVLVLAGLLGTAVSLPPSTAVTLSANGASAAP